MQWCLILKLEGRKFLNLIKIWKICFIDKLNGRHWWVDNCYKIFVIQAVWIWNHCVFLLMKMFGDKFCNFLLIEFFCYKVWEISVNLHVLDYDGNILDCANLAALCALAHFRWDFWLIIFRKTGFFSLFRYPAVTVIGTDVHVVRRLDLN